MLDLIKKTTTAQLLVAVSGSAHNAQFQGGAMLSDMNAL